MENPRPLGVVHRMFEAAGDLHRLQQGAATTTMLSPAAAFMLQTSLNPAPSYSTASRNPASAPCPHGIPSPTGPAVSWRRRTTVPWSRLPSPNNTFSDATTSPLASSHCHPRAPSPMLLRTRLNALTLMSLAILPPSAPCPSPSKWPSFGSISPVARGPRSLTSGGVARTTPCPMRTTSSRTSSAGELAPQRSAFCSATACACVPS